MTPERSNELRLMTPLTPEQERIIAPLRRVTKLLGRLEKAFKEEEFEIGERFVYESEARGVIIVSSQQVVIPVSRASINAYRGIALELYCEIKDKSVMQIPEISEEFSLYQQNRPEVSPKAQEVLKGYDKLLESLDQALVSKKF